MFGSMGARETDVSSQGAGVFRVWRFCCDSGGGGVFLVFFKKASGRTGRDIRLKDQLPMRGGSTNGKKREFYKVEDSRLVSRRDREGQAKVQAIPSYDGVVSPKWQKRKSETTPAMQGGRGLERNESRRVFEKIGGGGRRFILMAECER